eukprot:scaffold129352_cov45-Phaeocystis_antarctica.AAC.1
MLDMHRGHVIGLAVDVWALGCLLFSLAYCKHPFDSESPLQILNCNYAIPTDATYSSDLAHLIVAMLAPDPAHRPTVFEVTERASLLYAERMAAAPLPGSQPEEEEAAARGAP